MGPDLRAPRKARDRSGIRERRIRSGAPGAAMIIAYVEQALKGAAYEKLEDGTYVAEVEGLRGVLGAGTSLEACRTNLAEVVEEWVLVRVSRGLAVPTLGNVTVEIKHAS
jgi:predicted RNase H-like HicB family nuclease